MAYTPRIWVPREGTNLNRFTKSYEDANSVILTNAPTLVTVAGTPFNAESMNAIEQGIYKADGFDQVIDTDAKLLIWQSGGYDGACGKVLIRGQRSCADGVNLTARGTKIIVGEPGSKLTFTNTSDGLYYTTAPTTNDYMIKNVDVSCTKGSGGHGFGFFNCRNLIHCTGYGSGSSGSGFSACTNLIFCIGSGSVTGFNGECKNLLYCDGPGKANSNGLVSEGILFPSTQVPSSNVNTLDDYEEGTWTPSLSIGGLYTGITYATQAGTYTKIGNRVSLDFYFTLTSKGTLTGALLITGAPFACKSGPNPPLAIAFGYINYTGMICAYILSNQANIQLITVVSGGVSTSCTDANATGASSLLGSVTYPVA